MRVPLAIPPRLKPPPAERLVVATCRVVPFATWFCAVDLWFCKVDLGLCEVGLVSVFARVALVERDSVARGVLACVSRRSSVRTLSSAE
jgi:hypothetical protein